jgi:hypothetical protein
VSADLRAPAVAEPALYRRYRWLLLAYPRSYRRRHGGEILTTLMDAAGPGRTRPTATEVRDLFVGGLRQRFRLPVGRLSVLAAVLTAITVGGLGAAVGSAGGWATARSAPDDATVVGLAELAMGDKHRLDLQRVDSAFGLRDSTVAGTAMFTTSWSAEATRTRLEAAGWRVGPAETPRPRDDDGATPTDVVRLVAERDGLVLEVSVHTFLPGQTASSPDGSDPAGSFALVLVDQAQPAVVVPLMVAGGVLGLLVGWIIAARVGYRLRRAVLWQRVPLAVLANGALLLLAPWTLAAWFTTGEVLLTAVTGRAATDRPTGSAAHEAYAYIVGPNGFAVGGALVGVFVIALAYAARPGKRVAEVRLDR